MEHTIKNIEVMSATSFLYLLFGGWDVALKVLVIVMIIDYITGMMSAIYNKKVNSKVGFKGILKKSTYLLIVILAVLLDTLLSSNGTIRNMIIYFFVANDGISILENAGELNIPLPKKILEILEQLKKED